MNLNSIIPLVAGIAYLPLVVIILINRPWQKRHKLFAIYLASSILWSYSAFLLRSDLFTEFKVLIWQVLMCSVIWTAVQYYYFLRFYLFSSGGLIVRFGYTLLALTVISMAVGEIPKSVIVENSQVTVILGWWILLISIPPLLIMFRLIYLLTIRFQSSSDPIERNRIKYFFLGVTINTSFAVLGLTPIGTIIPIGLIGHLINACLLTYASLKYQILDTKLILRRTVFYSFVVGLYSAAYSLWFFLIHTVIGFDLNFGSSALVVLLTVTTASAFWVKAREKLTEEVELLFFGKAYYKRQELFNFLKNKVPAILNLKDLIAELLPLLSAILGCQRLYMLFAEYTEGDLVSNFSDRNMPEDKKLRIKKSSPIVNWLKREQRYLTIENLDILPEFKGLWAEEIKQIKDLDIQLFFPFMNKQTLIGILAVSKKKSGKYSLDETILVEKTAREIAIILEKEYLQEQIERQEKELALINRLAVVITSSLNIQEVYETFISGLREILDVDFATIATIEGDNLHFSAVSSHVGSAWKIGEKIPLSNTPIEWTIKHRKSLMEPNLDQDSIFTSGKEFLRRGIRSIIYLPLITQYEGIGTMIIGSRRPNAYGVNQISMLEQLASQISTSIANSQLYSRAEQRARIDELTGLYNRRHFDETLKHEAERHSRYGSLLSLAIIDLDNFKHYNDSYGHPAGDKLLSQIGSFIQKAIRNVDFAFRYGGDEFAIIMPHTSAENAVSVTERISNLITQETAKAKILITVSIGIASWPHDALTPDDLVDAADKALYHCKRTGGNRNCLVSQMMSSIVQIEKTNSDIEKEALNTIYALASTIEARDPYTYGHSQKVRTYAVALAEALNLPSEKVAVISHAALLHDIGKIGIYDEILNKPGALDAQEFELIKTHPELSRNIVAHIISLTPCLQPILQHHERWDGKGYPNGIKGESICLEARILGIADSFDAMTSKRPYHEPMTSKKAVQELKRCAGTQFDPKLIDVFIPVALSINPREILIQPHLNKRELIKLP